MITLEKSNTSSLASQLMAIEVISELLLSTSPEKLGETLTTCLRELTGAKTVMVITLSPESHQYELLHVSPTRRSGLFSSEELNHFSYEKSPDTLPLVTDEFPGHHPLKNILTGAGIQSMARFSLSVGGELVGLLLLFDMPDISRFAETVTIIKPLVPPIALSLKNALSYQKIELLAAELERRVEERTLELQEKNSELLRSEERSRTVLQTAMEGFWLLDLDTCIIDVNDAYCQMSGYSRRELVGMHVKDLEINDSEEVIANRVRRITESGGDRFESRHRHKDGSDFLVDVSVKYLQIDCGQLAVFVRDITESRQREIELRETRAMLQAALDCSPAGIALADAPDGKLRYVNDAGLKIRGSDRQSIVDGVGIDRYVASWQLLDLDGRPLRSDEVPLARAIMFGETNSREFIIRRLECDDRVVLANASPIRDESGAVRAGIVVFTDITDHKRAELELEENRKQYRNLVEGTPDLITRVDTEGRFIFVNHTAKRIFGLPPEECVGRLAFDFIHPDDRGSTEAAFNNWLQSSEDILKHENRLVGIDGQGHYHMTWSICAERDEIGTVTGFAGTARDITEYKHAHEEKEQLEYQLQQALKMESIGRLAGGVAHDFNNMLSIILGHAELGLMHIEPTHPAAVDLKEISNTAQRSADLTRQLLAFARKQTVAPKLLDLNKIIAETLKMVQRLIGEDIHLTWQTTPELWQIRIDPTQLDQILINLCINARDAIEGTGSIAIETTNRNIDKEYCRSNLEATPGEYICLTVSDTGCGMDMKTRALIFEPFYTTKEMGKGSGLGLATVYGAVKQNNGFINIYSEIGKGTTFSIYLPRDESSKSDQVLAEPAVAQPLRGKETILLVEDEPAILDVTSMMLEMQGYSVLKANSPGDAVRMARAHSGEIHLLMTDVIMPEMNGRDLASSLLPIYPKMKRLFMSGYTADIIANHGVLEEGVQFIQKPFSLLEMAAKVREALDCT